MHRTAGILASLMVDSVVSREGTAQRHKRLPLIAHQMSAGVDRLTENPIGLGLGQILDHYGPSFTSGCADAHIRRPLHSHKRRSFQGFRLTFPAPPWRSAVHLSPRLATHIEAIDLDDTIQGLLAPDHQTQSVPHAPGRRLADTEGF